MHQLRNTGQRMWVILLTPAQFLTCMRGGSGPFLADKADLLGVLQVVPVALGQPPVHRHLHPHNLVHQPACTKREYCFVQGSNLKGMSL